MSYHWEFKRVLVFVLIFSAAYALFELRLRPWLWIMPGTFQIEGLSSYHLLFMLPVFVVMSIIPGARGLLSDKKREARASIVLAIGIFFLAVLLEDILYFVFELTPIKAGMWTTQWGYFSVLGQAVPDWYIIYATFSALALTRVYSLALISTQSVVHRAQLQLRIFTSIVARFRRAL
jgi:hypothetical protein